MYMIKSFIFILYYFRYTFLTPILLRFFGAKPLNLRLITINYKLFATDCSAYRKPNFAQIFIVKYTTWLKCCPPHFRRPLALGDQ